MQNQEHCGTGYETDCNSRSRTYLLSDVHTYTIQDRIYVRYVCMIHVYRSTTHRMAGRRHPLPFQIAQKPPNIDVNIWRFLGDLRKAMALSAFECRRPAKSPRILPAKPFDRTGLLLLTIFFVLGEIPTTLFKIHYVCMHAHTQLQS